MSTTEHRRREPTLARTIAAEDLRRGDYVAVLSVVYELPSFLWNCDSTLLPADEPVRMRLRGCGGGEPLRVLDACLPFVLVETCRGRSRTLDVRACQLARLDRKYAKRAFRRLSTRKRSRRRVS